MNVQLVSLVVRSLNEYADASDLLLLDDESLRSTYPELSKDDRDAVLQLVSKKYEPICAYSFLQGMKGKDYEWFAECALEGLHSSLDGWDHEQQVVIELFLIDMCRYVQGARDMKLS